MMVINDATGARLIHQVIVVEEKQREKMIHGCYAQPSFHAVTHLIMPLSSNVLYSACLPIQFKREYPYVLNIFYLCLLFFSFRAPCILSGSLPQ